VSNFFLDPIGGNDANDGTTFANRWKTIAGGATAARIAPGDIVRIIASPDASSLGSATWTNSSSTITLAAACTQTIDNGESAWTASTNITTTTSVSHKEGTNSASIAIGSTFTTGKAAFKATGTLDLSGYQQVSFWINSSIDNVPAGALELRLCTDTSGATSAHAITIDRAFNSGWTVVTKDFGSNLNSSIKSVALYVISDFGAGTFLLDNIIACKASSNAASLTHLSLIGKNTVGEPEWYPVLGINGTSVTLGNSQSTDLNSASLTPRTYSGTSESVTTYKIQPIDGVNYGGSSPQFQSSSRTVQDSGTNGSPITFSGGWDRTNMSTQSGVSWLTCSYWAGAAIDLNGQDYIKIEKVGVAHANGAPITVTSSNVNCNISLTGVAACSSLTFNAGTSLVLDLGNVMSCGAGLVVPAATALQRVKLTARRISGILGGTGGLACALPCVSGARVDANIDKIDNNAGYGIATSSDSAGETTYYNTTLANNVTADIVVSSGGKGTTLYNCTLSSTTPIESSGTLCDTLRIHKYGGSATDHRLINASYQIKSDTSVRNTASDFSWKLSPLSTALSVDNPQCEFVLANLLMAANVSKTINVYARRDSTNITVGIKIRGGQIAGVSSDMTATVSASANTWQQISLTITPTEDGVIELFGYAYSTTATNLNGWFDDLSIT
jgi:hypothetical protein